MANLQNVRLHSCHQSIAIVIKQMGEVELPENDVDTFVVGCKKASNVNKFYDRTAGILALVRPCGIIVNFSEMFACESVTQAYVFIFTTFGCAI